MTKDEKKAAVSISKKKNNLQQKVRVRKGATMKDEKKAAVSTSKNKKGLLEKTRDKKEAMTKDEEKAAVSISKKKKSLRDKKKGTTKDDKKAAFSISKKISKKKMKSLIEKIRDRKGAMKKDEKREAFSISKRKKSLDEKIRVRKRLIEESMRKTLLEAARNDWMLFKFRDLEDSFPAIGVSIGGYKRVTGKDVTVTAFFSYGGRCLEWEIAEGPLRHRLRVRWHAINKLELKLNECGQACLSDEIKYSPTCWKFDPKYRWSNSRDFTDGEILRGLPPHFVLFEPGTIDKSFVKLLNYVNGLALLAEKNRERYRRHLLEESIALLSLSTS